MQIRRHGPGQVVCGPNSLPGLYILKSGRVRLYRLTSDGREVTLLTATPGDVFGVIGPDPATVTVGEAMQDTVVCVVDEVALNHIVVADPTVAVDLLSRLSERLNIAEERVEELAFASAPQRVARALLRRCPGNFGLLRTTHADLAKDAAVARETVSKVLADLEAGGVVTTRRRLVRILDLPALKAKAWSGLVSAQPGQTPTLRPQDQAG